jgi:hypothetical protein
LCCTLQWLSIKCTQCLHINRLQYDPPRVTMCTDCMLKVILVHISTCTQTWIRTSCHTYVCVFILNTNLKSILSVADSTRKHWHYTYYSTAYNEFRTDKTHLNAGLRLGECMHVGINRSSQLDRKITDHHSLPIQLLRSFKKPYVIIYVGTGNLQLERLHYKKSSRT